MTAFMAMAVAHLVSMEVLGRTVPPVVRSVAMIRIFTVVAVIRPVAIVDVAMEVFRTMKPWARTDKDAIGKPLGTIVSVGSSTVRRGVVVTVRTNRGYTYSNADLGLCSGSTCCNG